MEDNSLHNYNGEKDNEPNLIINLNEEYKIKIEKGNQFYKSIFKDVYTAALNNVEGIVDQANQQNDYDNFNNIIAFTGERGKGKSSSMISFRNALINHHLEINSEFFSNKKEIVSKQFATIDIVDPSLFRGGESLFEIILAQMFNKFQVDIKCEKSKVSDDDRRALIKQFQEVFENLQIINSDRTDLYKKESIEALSKLATSSTLRNCFKDLVSIYLQKFERQKDYLVIAIDDFDLNTSGAYEMLENIRQFLIQPNIILLIACKVEQLRVVVLNHFYREFELLLKYHSTEITELDLINKSEKYLEKLIPNEKRLILPNPKMF